MKGSIHLLNVFSFDAPCRSAFALPCSFNIEKRAVNCRRLIVLDSLNELEPNTRGLPALKRSCDGYVRLAWVMLARRDNLRQPLELWSRVAQALVLKDDGWSFQQMSAYSRNRAAELSRRGGAVKDNLFSSLICNSMAHYLSVFNQAAESQ